MKCSDFLPSPIAPKRVPIENGLNKVQKRKFERNTMAPSDFEYLARFGREELKTEILAVLILPFP